MNITRFCRVAMGATALSLLLTVPVLAQVQYYVQIPAATMSPPSADWINDSFKLPSVTTAFGVGEILFGPGLPEFVPDVSPPKKVPARAASAAFRVARGGQEWLTLSRTGQAVSSIRLIKVTSTEQTSRRCPHSC